MKEYQLVGNDTAPTVQLFHETKKEVKLLCSDGRKMRMDKKIFEKNFTEVVQEDETSK